MTLEEYLAADYEEGYRYELIRGELYVSPQPNPDHDWIHEYLSELLTIYKLNHRKIVKRLSSHCRVFVPGEPKATCPEPDYALYNDSASARGQKSWQEFSPFVVIEIVSDSDPDKDYVRNVELYQKVPTIREYWLFDKAEEVDGPILRVYRRDSGGQPWEIEEYDATAIYSTPLLPGFKLPVSPD